MGTEFASVQDSERRHAVATLVLAFTADPFLRWLYPEAEQYLKSFPDVLQAFAGAAFTENTVWRLGDFAAVALWLRPGVEPDADATVAVLSATVASDKLEDLLAVFVQMDEAHPKTRHWYLPWFGVDCALQEQGLGADLMRRRLQVLDADHLPAYLDSTNPRNIPFYERHGFEVTAESRAGLSLAITSMLRAPR